MKQKLIIGYGNLLRGDDGVGQRVAEMIQSRQGVQSVACHQLTPELTVLIAQSSLVIFVDAYPAETPVDRIQVSSIVPQKNEKGYRSRSTLGHTEHPNHLLQLTQDLYYYAPPAWLITIPAFDFSFGESLSPLTEIALQQALKEIQSLLNNSP